MSGCPPVWCKSFRWRYAWLCVLRAVSFHVSSSWSTIRIFILTTHITLLYSFPCINLWMVVWRCDRGNLTWEGMQSSKVTLSLPMLKLWVYLSCVFFPMRIFKGRGGVLWHFTRRQLNKCFEVKKKVFILSARWQIKYYFYDSILYGNLKKQKKMFKNEIVKFKL